MYVLLRQDLPYLHSQSSSSFSNVTARHILDSSDNRRYRQSFGGSLVGLKIEQVLVLGSQPWRDEW